MPEPATILDVKISTAATIVVGSFVAGLLMKDQPLHVRVIAGTCGCAAAAILTPLLTPIAVAAWEKIYIWLSINPKELPRDAVAGFVGFATGLTGIDICRWIIERTKFGLSILKFPPWKKGSKGD